MRPSVISWNLKPQNTEWIKYDRPADSLQKQQPGIALKKNRTKSEITAAVCQASRAVVTGASIQAKINYKCPVSCCSKVEGQRREMFEYCTAGDQWIYTNISCDLRVMSRCYHVTVCAVKNVVLWHAGFLPWSITQRHSRFPHERHHVSHVWTVAAVLQESLGVKEERTGSFCNQRLPFTKELSFSSQLVYTKLQDIFVCLFVCLHFINLNAH